MTRRTCYPLVVVAVLAMTARPAAAWHDRGHMAVALIAYRQLPDATQRKIQELLRAHPHYDEFLSAKRPADAPLEEWVVMQAAVWPDWVRENHRDEGFNHPYHHYADQPLKRLQGASEEQVRAIERNIAALPNKDSSGQLLDELPKRYDEVKDADTEAKTRAIAMCWVLHLVGDIHQPLHAATMFTKYSPEGDHGGNSAYIRWHDRAENLHYLWDGIVGWDEFSNPMFTPYGVVDLMVRDFQQRHPLTAAERNVSDVKDWAAESRDVAEREAYAFQGREFKIFFVADHHPHLNGARMPRLPDGYAERAREVAEKRVVLGGNRLADRLKQLLP